MFHEKRVNGVQFLFSDLLPCPHGFSTREGGVSSLPHLKSMNLGENRGDTPENVAENTRRFCLAAGLPQSTVSARQIHSDRVLYRSEGLKEGEERPECDGFYTEKQGVSLFVKIADCIPVLLYAPDAGAVAALHAGWRGTAKNIAGVGVSKLSALGADPQKMRAAIGAGIGQCCYQVDDPFIDAFLGALGQDFACFLKKNHGDGRYYADLKGSNKALLIRAGLREEHIDLCTRCTMCESDLFFSHRATKGERGTMGAAIALP